MRRDAELEPVCEVVDRSSLPPARRLERAEMIKLNGDLGTSLARAVPNR